MNSDAVETTKNVGGDASAGRPPGHTASGQSTPRNGGLRTRIRCAEEQKLPGRVAGKVALVTGGASGLGEAIATMLANEGAKVVIADIDSTQGPEVAARIRATGGEAIYLPLDVTQEVAWKNTVDAVLAHYAHLNILVNNAGIAPPGSMTMSFELWRKVLSINLDGTFLGMKYAIQAMRDTRTEGSIINISSVMAMVGQPTTAAYSASKGGVRSLTKAAAIYCAAEKLPIRVNSVHPGTCRTPLVDSHYASQPNALREQIARHPIGHLGQPDDIAYGVLYLASDESRFVLGTELVIDGGLLASD
jgi:3(or 17)beta-hydroxysteroid dehydrogenase